MNIMTWNTANHLFQSLQAFPANLVLDRPVVVAAGQRLDQTCRQLVDVNPKAGRVTQPAAYIAGFDVACDCLQRLPGTLAPGAAV